MRSAFNKDVLRSISHSWGRFLAIAVMAALGCGFYAGLRMTGPDMRLAGDEYYDATNLCDLRVVSTLGLNDDEVDMLRSVEGVSGVMPAREADMIADLDGTQYTFRVHSLDVDSARQSTCADGVHVESANNDYLNRLILVEGEWPSSANECLLSADATWTGEVGIGDTVRVMESTQDLDDTFSVREFTVTGFIRSSYYTCSTSPGTTTLGSGQLSSCLYVPDGAFADDFPITEVFVTVEGAAGEKWGSDAYQEVVDDVSRRLNDLSPRIAASRLDGIAADAQAELDASRDEYERQRSDAYAQIDDAQQTLDDAASQLSSARSKLASAAAQLASSSETIASGKQQLSEGRSQLQSAEAELESQQSAAEEALAAAQARLDEAQARYDEATSKRGELEVQLAQARAAGIEEAIEQLEAAIAAIDEQTAGVPEQLSEGRAQIEQQRMEAYAQLDDARAQLDDARAQLDDAQATLASGEEQLASGQAEYASGQAEYASGLAEYTDGQAELDEKRAEADEKFADAKRQLDEAQAEIDDIANEDIDVYVLDRTKNVGAEGFRSDAGRIDQIAQVFPLLFFLVAALVSLTTMTRMVDEERVLIGTYKALGYSGARITSKYLVYAVVASGIGAFAGIAALSQFLPWFIMHAYSIMYSVPCVPTPIDAPLAVLSAALGVGITVAATAFAAASSLRERPATLMLPRAPKAGKRILLERIRPLWSRMSFSWKVTARNLFRYKRRFFMAIVGIAGCTALLLTGLGLQNAINDIIDKQFYDLYRYNTIVRVADGATQEQKAAVENLAAGMAEGDSTWVCVENKIVCSADGALEHRVDLDVPSDPDSFSSFNVLRERVSGKELSLDDDGVIISEKLATALCVGVGDSVDIFDEDAVGNVTGEGRTVRVSAIMENYVGQVVFMTPDLYAQVMGESPTFSTFYTKLGSDTGARQEFSDEVLGLENVKTCTYNDETIESYRTMLKSVDSVVVVLVVAAALLAFVVLYNLTNINITERIREIATLKVLGFTPHEVNAYIYRETLLLAVIGAAFGLVLGVVMEGYVITTAEVDQVMFGRDIHVASFVIAFVLTMVFSIVVTLAMRGKLRRVDMVESLKSNE